METAANAKTTYSSKVPLRKYYAIEDVLSLKR